MFGRAAWRRSGPDFADVAAGQVGSYALDLEENPDEGTRLAMFAGGLPRRSPEIRRLRLALEPAARARLLDLLAARQTPPRLLAVRLCGSLELEEAVPWLEIRLSDRNRSVREAAARALGRIGGARAADALLRALPRERVSWFRLAVELAKAAPFLHLEAALADPGLAEQRAAVMVALGMRRPGLDASEFLGSAPIGAPRDLVAACHVLARSRGAAAWLTSLLEHPDRRVRAAADRALRRLRNAAARPVYLVRGAGA